MTKPKLTDALKPASQALPETGQTPAADSGGGGEAGNPPAADKGNDDDDDDDDEPASSKDDKPTDPPAPAKAAAEEPAKNSLEAYQAAFGETQGCVYFAKQIDFTTACTLHMSQQASQITTLTAEIEQLKTQAKKLAGEVLGEVEPVKTKTDAKSSAAAASLGSDALASFASGIKIPGQSA